VSPGKAEVLQRYPETDYADAEFPKDIPIVRFHICFWSKLALKCLVLVITVLIGCLHTVLLSSRVANVI
jgi:hypothetical protein